MRKTKRSLSDNCKYWE